MILNKAAILAAATGFRAVFLEGWNQATPLHTDFVLEVQSTGDSEVYNWSDSFGAMREWIGERVVENIKAWDYTLRNRNWERTLGVDRNLFEDDKLGLIKPKFMSLGVAARQHPDKLFSELVTNGFSATCYDGKAFFATNHPLKTGTNSNLQTGALDSTNFNAAIAKLRGMKSYDGEPIDVLNIGGELVLMVGPSLESTARALLLAQQGASGATNTDFNRAKLVVNPRITTGAWFLFVAKAPVRPFILQMRRKPELVARDQPTDDTVWAKREVQYGVDGRWEAGYGLYQLAVGSTGS